MASLTGIKIPKYRHTAIRCLVSLTEAQFQTLARVLDEAGPRPYYSDLLAYVANRVPLEREDVEELINFLLSLYQAEDFAESDIPRLAGEVVAAIQATGQQDLEPADGNWQMLKARLARLLDFDQSLGTTAKALNVMTQAEIDHHPLRSSAGIFKDDPFWDEAMAAIADYRREIDEQYNASEQADVSS